MSLGPAQLSAESLLVGEERAATKAQFRPRNPTPYTPPPQGTITHMAPEVLMKGCLSKASDVYAFGITL